MSNKARWYVIWTIAIVLQWGVLLGGIFVPGDGFSKLLFLIVVVIGVNFVAVRLARSTGYSPPRNWLPFGGGTPTRDEDGRTLRLRGVEALKKGDHGQLVEIYTQLIHRDEGNAEIYLARAQSRSHLKQFDPAIKDFTIALVTGEQPVKVQALLGRARIYLERGEAELCVQDASEALEHDPENTEALEVRRQAYQALGTPELSAADQRKLAELTRPFVRVAVNDQSGEIELTSRELAGLEADEDFRKRARDLTVRLLQQLSRKAAQEASREMPELAASKDRNARFATMRELSRSWLNRLSEEDRESLEREVEVQLRGLHALAH